jgi:hypothetical protein
MKNSNHAKKKRCFHIFAGIMLPALGEFGSKIRRISAIIPPGSTSRRNLVLILKFVGHEWGLIQVIGLEAWRVAKFTPFFFINKFRTINRKRKSSKRKRKSASYTKCKSKSVQSHSGIMPMNRNIKYNRVCEDWTVIFLQSVLHHYPN